MEKKSIVICEDNTDLQKVLTSTLNQHEDLQAKCLTTGLELLRYLIEEPTPPDLLVIDYMLPDIEGDDIVETLHKNPTYRNIPIILMSGVVVNVKDSARTVGADSYLTKPFSLKEFEEKVYELL